MPFGSAFVSLFLARSGVPLAAGCLLNRAGESETEIRAECLILPRYQTRAFGCRILGDMGPELIWAATPPELNYPAAAAEINRFPSRHFDGIPLRHMIARDITGVMSQNVSGQS